MSQKNTENLSVIDAIEQRRSVKHYDPTHKMSRSEIERLLQLAALSPTAFNIQPTRYIVVQDEATKAAISPLAHNQPQVIESSVLFVLTGALDAYKNAARYWPDAPAEAQAGIVAAIKGSYEGKPQAQRDEALLSGGMAATTLMLAAKALGYDSCPMKGFDFAAVGKLLNVPENEVVVMMIAVGKKAAEPHRRAGTLGIDELVRWEDTAR
ncbi:MAG: nitroreductase family protein [Opitutales bacterium]|nr:nitroreductase family protein [Opitutales bacterium]